MGGILGASPHSRNGKEARERPARRWRVPSLHPARPLRDSGVDTLSCDALKEAQRSDPADTRQEHSLIQSRTIAARPMLDRR